MRIGIFSRKVVAPALGALALVGAFGVAAQAEDVHSVDLDTGRQLFNDWSCSACHTLTDAGSSGAVGPSLDNPQLTRDFIVGRVSNGQGAMPSFGGQISDEDIAKLADYIVTVNHKDAAVAAASTTDHQNH